MGFHLDNTADSGATGASFSDGLFQLYSASDGTKKLKFNLSGSTTGTTTYIATSSTVNRTITLPDASCTLRGSNGALTSGSVLFFDGTYLAQNNANFFWDNASQHLGIGTNAPGQEITISKTVNAGFASQLIENLSAVAGSGAKIRVKSSTGQAFYQASHDATQSYAFGIDTTDNRFKLGAGVDLTTLTALSCSSAGAVRLDQLTASLPLKLNASKDIISQAISLTSSEVSGLTTKGDLLSYTGAANARLGVGSDGQVLTADSSQSTGLGWQTSPPSGSVIMYGGAAAPTGWLLCDGSSVLRATYAALFTAIGTTYGSVDGTHFTLPDFRGIFPRGAGTNGTLSDAGGAAFTGTLGTYQNDKMQGHYHETVIYATATGTNIFPTCNTGANNNGSLVTGNGVRISGNEATISGPIAGGFSTPRVGAETNPANLGISFIIKT